MVRRTKEHHCSSKTATKLHKIHHQKVFPFFLTQSKMADVSKIIFEHIQNASNLWREKRVFDEGSPRPSFIPSPACAAGKSAFEGKIQVEAGGLF